MVKLPIKFFKPASQTQFQFWKEHFPFTVLAPSHVPTQFFSRQSCKGWMQGCARDMLRHHGQNNMVKAMWSTKWGECQEKGWGKLARGLERFLRAGVTIGVGRHRASHSKALQGAVCCVFLITRGILQDNPTLGVAWAQSEWQSYPQSTYSLTIARDVLRGKLVLSEQVGDVRGSNASTAAASTLWVLFPAMTVKHSLKQGSGRGRWASLRDSDGDFLFTAQNMPVWEKRWRCLHGNSENRWQQ